MIINIYQWDSNIKHMFQWESNDNNYKTYVSSNDKITMKIYINYKKYISTIKQFSVGKTEKNIVNYKITKNTIFQWES